MQQNRIELFKTYVEDAISTMLRMADSSVDLIVTSPPYDDLRTYKAFKFHFKEIARNIARVLKPGGVCVWVVGDQVVNSKYGGSTETLTSFRQALYFQEVCGLNMHDTMIYEKNGSAMPDTSRYLQSFEYMFVFSKGRPNTINLIADRRNRFPERWGDGKTVREKDGNLTTRKKNENVNILGRRFNIWKFNSGFGHSSKDVIAFQHPAIFPENLAADHILSWSNEGDIVYDPFHGSGTVGKVSNLLNRKWVASEISYTYAVDIATKRISFHKQQPTLFENGTITRP